MLGMLEAISAPMPSGVEHKEIDFSARSPTPAISAPMPSGVEHKLLQKITSGEITCDLRSYALGR